MMFKKSRRKIVVSIMSILVALWGGTLGVIYTSSYIEIAKQNKQMLKAYAETYSVSGSFEELLPPNIPRPNGNLFKPDFLDSPTFRLSTFYAVAISSGGEIIEVKNDSPTIYSNSELEKLAQGIIKGKKINGTKNNLAFYKTQKSGYNLVVFMDNTVINERAGSLFRYTLIFGGLALIAFFFISVFLARKIVNPLEESYQKQKQFISDAGHELKTPVSVVSANAELLSRELGDNQWLSNIQYENERMGLLVTKLLELARTENVKIETEPVNLSRLVDGEILPFESVAFEKGLTLNTEVADNICVMGNSASLKQLVSILIDNAISHSEEAGEVYLSLRKEHSFALLSVKNRGEEIPKEAKEQIFERFYRVDAARTDKDNHFGLGLAIAKSIVLSHKGNIEVLCYDGLVEFKCQLPLL